MDLTPIQIGLARHALGLKDGRKSSYRNHFVTGEGSADHEPWTAMVASGAAKRFPGNVLSGGDDVFVLTRAGAEAVLKRGETLDPEDFPARPTTGDADDRT